MAVKTDILAHWYTLLGDMQASGLEFYKSVEANVAKRQVPDAKASRVEFKEGGVLTAKREYLRVTRGKLVFDICAAPYGTGFFISWWMGRPIPKLNPLILLGAALGSVVVLALLVYRIGFFLGPLIFLAAIPTGMWFLAYLADEGQVDDDWMFAIPILGLIYAKYFAPDTYYKMDTAQMFQESIRAAVLEAVDGLTSAKGHRMLTELERKPILRGLQPR